MAEKIGYTLKSLIEEHARLDFSDFLSTLLLAIFHVINKKFHPARLWTYLVKKQAGGIFSKPCLFILVCSSIRDFKVVKSPVLGLQRAPENSKFAPSVQFSLPRASNKLSRTQAVVNTP